LYAFNLPNLPSSNIAIGFTQPLTEILYNTILFAVFTSTFNKLCKTYLMARKRVLCSVLL
jgi:hypothetical protein